MQKWESGYNRKPKTFEDDNKELLTNKLNSIK